MRHIVILFLLLLPLSVMAQGQISRQPTKQSSQSRISTKKKNSKPKKSQVHSKSRAQASTPKAVDLGLPSGTLWADRNIGANSPTDYGGLYRYGASETNLDGSGSEPSQSENIKGTNEDIALLKWGKPWSLPSLEQAKELLAYCIITKGTVNGVKCAKFIGPNGRSLLFPLAGYMLNYGRSQKGLSGIYLTGQKSLCIDVSIYGEDTREITEWGWELKWACSVRAVQDP